jgi:copper chaperone NosL
MIKMAKKLSVGSMASLIGAAGLIFASIKFPWWGMKFYAPQYREGLDIIVYPSKLEGNIEIVNGLNHYIGMAPFSNESFPELQYLPGLITGLAVIIIIIALLRRKNLLYIPAGLLIVGGAIGIYDMNRWLTKFGTELDPKAPIELEPFVPPIIGENILANFVTHSYFTTGSFLLGAAFLLTLLPFWLERRK